MNAALACPGPSLTRTFPGRRGFDCLVAVNRAGACVPADWWAACDLPRVLQTSPGVSNCNLLTNADTLASLRRRGHYRASTCVVTTEDLRDVCPVRLFPLYTATAALVLLAKLGATCVRVYGADWTGVEDFDGTLAGENRTAERWKAERQIWGEVVEWMRGQGCEVERIGAPGQS